MISALTLIGVALGVATLIVVMSVMNGFRAELLTKILGLNGHFTAYPIDGKFTDYDETAMKLEKVNGVLYAIPYVEGQALACGSAANRRACRCAASRRPRSRSCTLLKNGAVLGGWDQLGQGPGRRHRPAARRKARRRHRRSHHHHQPQRRQHALRQDPEDPLLPGHGDLQPRHGRVRQLLRLHADASRRRTISSSTRTC